MFAFRMPLVGDIPLGAAVFTCGVAVGIAVGISLAQRYTAKTPTATSSKAALPTITKASATEVDSDDDGDVPEDVELKMVIAVRADLGMSKGKVAAQVGHAVLACYRQALRANPEFVKAWLHRAQAKVTLKIDDEASMDAVANAARARGITVAVIEDAGRTEVEPGTRTVVGLGPAPRSLIDAVTGPKGSNPLRLLT